MTHNSDPNAFDARVGALPGASDVPGYASIAAAVAAAPPAGDAPFRIHVGPGTWRERVIVDRPNVHLIGADPAHTLLVFSRHAGLPGPGGSPIGTFETATLKVTAPLFRTENLTIANDYDYVANETAEAGDDTVGHHAGQAVALALEGEADRSVLANVHLLGHQDTLYAHAGRSLFRLCRIAGSVDFIFGGGRAVFENCTIVSRHRPGQGVNGFIAAPNTNRHQPVGFVFNRCRLEKDAGVAPGAVALGRPWRQTTQFSDGFHGHPDHVGAAVYIACWMDDHIAPEGWHAMNYNAKGGGRAELRPEDARLFEYGSTGPGAGPASVSRRMLDADMAREFSRDAVLDGWDVRM